MNLKKLPGVCYTRGLNSPVFATSGSLTPRVYDTPESLTTRCMLQPGGGVNYYTGESIFPL